MSTADSYQSPAGFADQPITALAVYCADGRFGPHFRRFLERHLGLRVYDTLALPGGPAAIVHDDPPGLMPAARTQMRFLLQAHPIEHVILIAHDQCAFYRQHLGCDPAELPQRQRADLAAVATWLNSAAPSATISSYQARLYGGHVLFEPAT